MSASYARLSESISKAKNVRIYKNKDTAYDFKLYPFGERGTYIDPELISEITDNLASSITEHFPAFDYIVSPEPGGHTWGMLAAYKLMKPMNILRLSTELYENYEVCIKRETAYNENYIYFDGFTAGDRVLILDDVISSGATIRCIAQQMADMGVELVGVQGILAKGEHYKQLEADYGIPVRVLSKV
ncbi:Orotate phosphoribosyltransferase [Paenibacillus auburnensis]|uniref:Orotate phosphoribosyltransferase n=1 Tax=Paenibacillus auburnensis TaxID=2905649 RepID=A0ABM9CV00_9BACL|nr:phosphoribosyltransferase [Paenibacillus auburnensis]CAH1225260.1 Orotate phosphoribosyltransferase [Paenibacillus auburnensis]